MSNFIIFCDACGAEYEISSFLSSTEESPKFCVSCGEEIEKNSISERNLDATEDDDWEKLLDDFDDTFDWDDK